MPDENLPVDQVPDDQSSDDTGWAARFPALFAQQHIDYAGVTVRLTTAPAPDDLVNRLHLVAMTADGSVVVCRSTEGWRFLPGGTREPGESITALARRELLEEAGATALGPPSIFASFRVHSSRPEPYRPHLAHPDAIWAYGMCPVELTGPPTCPPDGEEVVEVATLPPEEAASWLARHDETHADVLRLAVAMGLVHDARPPAVESGRSGTSSR